MGFIGWVIGGLVGGVIGAAVWAGISYGTGYEIGWIAIGIGALVGVGVRMGSGVQPGGQIAGVVAAAIAILAILGGKYFAVELAISDLPENEEFLASTLSDLNDPEILMSYVADDVVEEYHEQGRAVNWPAGVDPETASRRVEYPSDVWADAEARWRAWSPADRADYREELEGTIRAGMSAMIDTFRGDIAREGFFQSFGLFDLVFGVLAIGAAFSIGGGTSGDN